MNGRAHNLEVGERLRDQGIADVTAADAAPHRMYGALVDESIAHYAKRGIPFDAEDVRARIERLHPDAVAHSPNVISAAFSKASKRRLIQHVDWVPTSRPSRHSAWVRVWQGVAA